MTDFTLLGSAQGGERMPIAEQLWSQIADLYVAVTDARRVGDKPAGAVEEMTMRFASLVYCSLPAGSGATEGRKAVIREIYSSLYSGDPEFVVLRAMIESAVDVHQATRPSLS